MTFDECTKILETFPNGEKTPGEDGFTAEFHKHFFDVVGHDPVDSLNTAYDVGQLSISQRIGVITLLTKDNAPITHLQNWRLITLLNVDYKIPSQKLSLKEQNQL